MNRLPRIAFASAAMIVISAMVHSPLVFAQQANHQPAVKTTKAIDTASKTPWVSLTGQWKACQFGGEGEVTIAGGVIKMEYGDPFTGVRWEGPFDGEQRKNEKIASEQPPKLKPLPRDNYELRWECRRDRGYDFMCAFTFPVAEKQASLVMGGWGGGITGISSIDGRDASDNDTTMFKAFDNDKWYSAKVRVDQKAITVWIDGTELFSHPRKDYDFDIRFEMDPCTPLGIANYECDSRIRKIQIRRLHESEIPSAKKSEN